MAQSVKEKMINILTRSNFLTAEQLADAVEHQKKTGRRLSEVLTMMGYISQRDLVIVFSQSMNIPPINLSRVKISTEVAQIIPKDIAQKYLVVPVSKIGKVLTIAVADPLNVLAIDELKILTNYEIKLALATEEEINKAIIACYAESTNDQIRDIIEDVKEMNLEVVEEHDEVKLASTQQLLKEVEDAPVVKVTNMLLAEAIRYQASDLLIEPQEKKVRVRLRLDGMLREFPSPPKSMQESIVSRIKVMAVLNIAEHRMPQDGRFKIKVGDREVDFRVSVMPTYHGEKVALRVLDKNAVVLDLDAMGFEPGPLKCIKELSREPHGMIMVCGPTGSGKSTTLYSILKYVDDPEKNMVTAEDPVEYQLHGINQVSVNPAVGLTFAGALRSFLRQDPDVIMVGEIRDTETLDTGIKAALTGHLVLSTLHTNEAAGAITRMVNMGIEPFLITSSCLLVVAQRLMRKLCPACRAAYAVNAEIRREYNLPDTVTELFRPKGCPACANTGYKGRTGLCEAMGFTPELRDLVMAKAQEGAIKKKAREQGMSTLRECGIDKVMRGITSLEEVSRLTIADDA